MKKKRRNLAYRKGGIDFRLHAGERQPGELIPLLGKTVRGVWLLPDGVFVSFEAGDILEVKPILIAQGDQGYYGLQVRVGLSKDPAFDWGTVLDEKCERLEHLVKHLATIRAEVAERQ